MDKFLLYGVIATLISLLAPIFTKDRNFYFVSLALLFAGLAIGVWGHERSKVDFENYTSKEVWLESATFKETDESLRIFAEGQEYILPRQNLSISDVEIVRRDGPNLFGAATIWTQPDEIIVTGIVSAQLIIDARTMAKSESSLFDRFRNVGIGIAVFGLLLFIFHYFTTPQISAFGRLTQKY